MLERFKAMMGRAGSSLSLVSPFLRNMLWTIKREFLDLARRGYSQNAVVYACIQLLAQSLPEPPLMVYQVDDAFRRVQVPFDHPLQRLIRAPNEQMTEYEMIELMEIQMDIAGTTYWWKRRNNLGEVIGLYPLRPDRVGPHYASNVIIDGWNYLAPGTNEQQFIPVSEMIAISLPNPTGETGGIVEGLGPLQVLAREVETDNEATNFVAALLKNSATPGGMLKVKTAISSKAKLEEIKQRFMAQFGGAKRGEPIVIDADSEYQAVGFNLQQLEFPNLRHVSESRIAAAFRVPAILVGLKVGLDAGIRATIQDQRRYFTETTLATRWRRISDALTKQLAPDFGDHLVLRFDLQQVKALSEQSRFEVMPVKEGYAVGAVLIDEYREKVMRLPALPDGQGQFVMVPVGYIPVPITGGAVAGQYDLTRDGDDDTGLDHGGDWSPGDDRYDPPPLAGKGGLGDLWAKRMAEDVDTWDDDFLGDDAEQAAEDAEDDDPAAIKGDTGVPHPHAGRPRGSVITQRGRIHHHRGRATTPKIGDKRPGGGGDRRAPKYAPDRSGTGGQPAAQDIRDKDDTKQDTATRKKRVQKKHGARVAKQGGRGLDKLTIAMNMHGLSVAARAETSATGKGWHLADADLITADERRRIENILREMTIATLHEAHRDAGEELDTSLAASLLDPAVKAVLDAIPARADALLAGAAVDMRKTLDHDHPDRYALAGAMQRLPNWSAGRAAKAMAHEAAHASNVATLLAYGQAGISEVLVSDDGDHACAACKAADGQRWNLAHAMANATEHPGCGRVFVPCLDDDTP